MAVSDKDPGEEFIQACYMDDGTEDRRLPHHREPEESVFLEQQLEEFGIFSFLSDSDNSKTDEELKKKIHEERGFSYVDPREEVVQAWYMNDSDEDQRLPHHREPKEFVSLKQLEELGVLSWRLDADNYETDEELKKIREERGYSYMDFCEVSPEKQPNYEENIKKFFVEHLHTDEEIRYTVAGSGYFDVRDKNDGWIRVWVKKGGMIVLPAGMYHRFTLDSNNYIKAVRLFVGDPVWTPFNRPHDHLPARKQYVEAFVQKKRNDHVVNAAA